MPLAEGPRVEEAESDDDRLLCTHTHQGSLAFSSARHELCSARPSFLYSWLPAASDERRALLTCAGWVWTWRNGWVWTWRNGKYSESDLIIDRFRSCVSNGAEL